MKRILLLVLCLAMVSVLIAAESGAADAGPKLSITEEDDGVTIRVDGKLFTRYLICSGTRPVLWPVIGPTDKPMTRAYPVAESGPGEEKDHIHHRSMWLGYEGLNENDYWHEPEKGITRPYPIGTVRHREFTSLKAEGSTATVVTNNDWLGGDGKPVCTDVRTLRFGCDKDQRWIDYQMELKPTDGPLRIADSKEGFFALRVASTMRVDAGLGGHIVTSAGKYDADAWAQRAKWVDYSGPVDGETLGIAILCHPSSYQPNPRWHVRTYGLFGVNPFGEKAFTDPATDITKRSLRITLPEDESLTFRYRVIFHRGDERQAKIAEQFASYVAEK